MIKISVIIPTYKPGKYIFKCLESLCEQSLEPSQYEILIILNGIKLPYYENLSSFLNSKVELNFQVIFDNDKGVSSARNLGLAISSGENICFIDDDDYVSPNYLECLLDAKENDSIVASNVVAFNDHTGEQCDDYLSDAFIAVVNKPYNIILYRTFLSSCWGKIIPKNILNNTIFDTDIFLGEDALFMFSISKNIPQIILSDSEAIYYRRVREGSASRTSRSFAKLLGQRVKLIFRYTKVYFSSPFDYSFTLYTTRVLATIRNIFR